MIGKLSPGILILYWDSDPNGIAVLKGPVKVIRAKGMGVLVETDNGSQFRLNRLDVERVKGV